MWERAITGLAKKLLSSDSGIIDVGANIGGVSHAFAQLVPDGKVIAIEANRLLIKQIRRKKRQYQLTNLHIRNRAAYKKTSRFLSSGLIVLSTHHPAHYIEIIKIKKGKWLQRSNLIP